MAMVTMQTYPIVRRIFYTLKRSDALLSAPSSIGDFLTAQVERTLRTLELDDTAACDACGVLQHTIELTAIAAAYVIWKVEEEDDEQ